MFEISTEASISAAHHLRDYEGPCEKVHGHNWVIRAAVRCATLNSLGIGIDFHRLRDALRTAISDLDHTDLNEAPGLAGVNPSSENLARYIFTTLERLLRDEPCRVHRVEVYETPRNCAAYYADDHD